MYPRLRIGILPASEHRARARLWAALEEAYPVRFEGRDRGALRGLDGVVALGGRVDADLLCLTLHGEEASGGPPRALALATDTALARPLRGARLSDAHATAFNGVGADDIGAGDTGADEIVLATLDDAPAWLFNPHGAGSHRVACAPAELGPEEALRERLRPGRCLALLALAHFLAQLTADLRPPSPPLSAAFLIDDPNLRRPRYGHLDYAELLRSARLHGYHLAVAMVPLDARLAHPRATGVFREGAKHLSLCVHGNDHDGPELGRIHSDARATALVAQALRRTFAFERRTGVPVDRVMVPPHERLSEAVARALHVCGFHALTATRPYPWVADTLDRSWLARPPGAGPLAAWRPFDAVAGGLPVLLRADFQQHPREDLVFRAFLGQPLILYGHHDLLAAGPDALAEAAAEINRLGDVRWRSLGTIASAIAHRAPLSNSHAHPTLDPSALGAVPPSSQRLAPLLRRLASEGRDRSTPARDRAAARAARPRSWSGRR